MRTAIALLLLTSVSHAAPIAQLSQDVDGDGRSDTVTLDANGDLVIGGQKINVGAAARAKLASSQLRGAPLVVVDTGTHAIILALRGGKWSEVSRTPLGAQGIDAEYAFAVDATPQGVYRYQTRAGAQRCDGKPAYLFAEGFNGTKFERLAKLPVAIPDAAPTISAKLDPSPAPAALLFKARLASHQPGASDASALAIPAELDDGKPATVWREDLRDSAGEGQFFTFTPRFAGAKAAQLRIVPGAIKGANRPQRLGIVGANGAWHVELPDAAKAPANSAYIADLPSPVEGCVTVIVESTYGADTGTLAIAELAVYAEGERSGGGGDAMLARVVAEGSAGATNAAQALARRGAAAVTALEAELARAKDAAARGRLVRVAIDIRDPAAAPLLARAVTQGIVRGSDLVAAVRALAGRGAGAELAAIAQTSGTPLEARVAAVTALDPTVDKERDALVALAGRGPREIRSTVIDRLSIIPVATLVPVATAQSGAPLSAAAAGDVWRAITRRAHAKLDERSAALAAMTAALPSATDYELRYRLVDGIAATGDLATLRALGATLASYPPDESTAAYKQIAARAIAVNPRPEASDLLVSFTRDRDPGVRLAALAALTSQTGTAEGPWNRDGGADAVDRVIITLLAGDTWPDVRRNAAQALGARCSRPGPAAALVDAVGKDADANVRGDALVGLVDCKAPGIAALLAKLWDDGKAPLDLRRRAVDLTATLGDRSLATALVGKYKAWRSAAIESEEALALAQNAAYVLGRLNPPGAAEALISALGDSAFPEVVTSAATGLGLLGPACPATARTRLQALATSSDEDAGVVMAARRSLQVCGKR